MYNFPEFWFIVISQNVEFSYCWNPKIYNFLECWCVFVSQNVELFRSSTAIRLRIMLRSARVRRICYVLLDVYWGAVSAQHCDRKRLAGVYILPAVPDDGLGHSCGDHLHLGDHNFDLLQDWHSAAVSWNHFKFYHSETKQTHNNAKD